MRVYFVRHGQSILNETKTRPATHQFPDTPLSDEGLSQASSVAERFKSIPLDLILTSSYKRALQTAQAIEKITPVSLVQSDLLTERRLPSIFRGKLTDDPEIAPIHQMIRANAYNPEWHHSDEENFYDLRKRVKKALEFIIEQNKENIAVITHGYFLSLTVCSMLFGDTLTQQQFKLFRGHISYSNTGLTMCEYESGCWKLLTFNDYAHLGE